MKKPQAILAVLLCYVLTASQALAIRGGPTTGPVGGSVLVNTTGTYSGVLMGTTETNANSGDDTPPAIPGDPDPGTPNGDTTTTTASNALGLFDLVVTTGGVAQGTFTVFSNGRVFRGTINGVADPSTGSLQGVLEASFMFNLQTVNAGVVTPVPITASVTGRLSSTIISPLVSVVTFPGQTASAGQLVTLSGTARLDLNFGQVDTNTLEPIINRSINFTVSGFRNTLNNGVALGSS